MRSILAAVSATALVATAVAGCSVAEKLTTGLKIKRAFEKLGDQPAASVLVSVDGSTGDAVRFLRAAGAGGGPDTRNTARLLTRGELTFAVGSDREETPLRELSRSERLRLAAAVNFGGKDVVAAKSVEEKLYLRVNLRSLVAQTGGDRAERKRARHTVGVADDLPATLASARDALQGKWVEADPESFDDFVQAAQKISTYGGRLSPADRRKTAEQRETEETSKRVSRATALGRALNGESEREFLDRLEKTVGKHASFQRAGRRGGADHVTVTMPARHAAEGLSSALEVLGARLDPSKAPDKTVRADLEIRRGQLTGLTTDLGQFVTGKGGARLPLRMTFGGGGAVSVKAPDGVRELQPQDLLAASMYTTLGTRGY
ncbi:hypothetical protein G5C65_06340 [Streptomyces sp. SB3404]|uniref:Lipoprotein n=1 Tax=Streptomyces boncukensis TaxID=2711219 RepID=A0A6G4WU37_9ACTN|nr:hypothetical protein [Streptomyces boncukensis]